MKHGFHSITVRRISLLLLLVRFITAAPIHAQNPPETDYSDLEARAPVHMVVQSSHNASVMAVAFSPDSRYVLYSTSNTIGLFDRENAARYSLAVSKDDWALFSPDGVFDTSKNGGGLVTVVKGMTDYGVDQFAVRNNRSDLILSRMGLGDPQLLDYFYGLYRKRLKRLDLSESQLSSDTHTPESRILETRRQGKYLTITFRLSDDRYELSRYNIYVNDVPLLGAYGRTLDRPETTGDSTQSGSDSSGVSGGSSVTLQETIELGVGENKIEVSCLNERGAES